MAERNEAERPANLREPIGGRDSPDDIVLPFATVQSRVAGRIVRLGPAANTILCSHDYPGAVSELLGEALALTALLGAPLKDDGRLILQTKCDGPVSFLVTHYDTPGALQCRTLGHSTITELPVREPSAARPVPSPPSPRLGRWSDHHVSRPGGRLGGLCGPPQHPARPACGPSPWPSRPASPAPAPGPS